VHGFTACVDAVPRHFFTFPNMLLKVTVVNFNVPGVIFDFASFSFQVPICGSSAKHIAASKKHNARVNPRFLFSWLHRDRISMHRQYFRANSN
jgi:hypothetical protein